MPRSSRWATPIALATLLSVVLLFCYTYKASGTSLPVLHVRSNGTRSDQFSAPVQAAFKPRKLTRQLVRTHAKNNTIVVAFANANALDYTFNWLTYVFANNITNYLIGAIDRTTEMTLADAGVNCFSMYDSHAKQAAELPEGDLPFLSPGFLTIGRHKLDLIKTLLSYKVNLVISDVDTVWLKDPLPYFAQFPQADILASTDIMMATHDDGGLEDPRVMGWEDLNIGVMVLRCNKGVIRFVDAWQQRLQQKGAQGWDQLEFNDLLRINMFKNHYSWWDHTDRWERVYKPKAPFLSNSSRILWGFDHTVTVGALPVAMFANGHVFFNQKLYERLQSPLYVVHANFGPGGGTKRHKLRETQLWQYDTPAYYNVSRLLSFDMHPLQPPGDWSNLPTTQRVRFHIRSVGVQLQQFWDAAGAAVALNRTLILPTFTCYCDELWYWSLEVKPSYGCRWPGAKNQTLPYACPHDQLVNYLQLEDNPAKYGSPVRYRESTFLENPRTPAAIKDDVMRIRLQLPERKDDARLPQPIRQQRLNQRLLQQQASEPIVTQTPVPWTVTEDELKFSLSQYNDHRLLHFTEMGHVVLNSYRKWDRRRSHASLDRWRFLLYTAVD